MLSLPNVAFSSRATPSRIYTLSLHDALPIYPPDERSEGVAVVLRRLANPYLPFDGRRNGGGLDRKSTRLNSSHTVISYAVFCLKKKKKDKTFPQEPRKRRNERVALFRADVQL